MKRGGRGFCQACGGVIQGDVGGFRTRCHCVVPRRGGLYSEHYCLDCGEPKESNEPNCGCGKSDDAVSLVDPTTAEQDIERHGYDSREHPFVLLQAERIRALEAERERLLAEYREGYRALEAELADVSVARLKEMARAEKLEAELADLKSEFAETSLVAYRHYEKAEKAEAKINRLKDHDWDAHSCLFWRRGGSECGVSAVHEAERAARPSEPNAAANPAAHDVCPVEGVPTRCSHCECPECCGGSESGESGSVAEGTGRDRIAAANPAATYPGVAEAEELYQRSHQSGGREREPMQTAMARELDRGISQVRTAAANHADLYRPDCNFPCCEDCMPKHAKGHYPHRPPPRNEGECHGPFHAGFLCDSCRVRFNEIWERADKAEEDPPRLLKKARWAPPEPIDKKPAPTPEPAAKAHEEP